MEYLYPQGLPKAVTFSYDDGMVYDRRLVQLMDQAGFKATFHLNSGNFGKSNYITAEEVKTLYQNHEVACHGVTHGRPLLMSQVEWLREIWQDRLALEALTGKLVQGLSYAFGEYRFEQVQALHTMGILYSRTVADTGKFCLPVDFLQWHPTCHHNNSVEMAEKLLHTPAHEKMPLLYIWGHSFEFEWHNTWDIPEQLAEKLAGAKDIWFATNGEIVAYITALRSLQQSADGHVLYNPSALPVWFLADGKVRVAEPGQVCQL